MELYQRRIAQLLERIQSLEKDRAQVSGGRGSGRSRADDLLAGQWAAPLPSDKRDSKPADERSVAASEAKTDAPAIKSAEEVSDITEQGLLEIEKELERSSAAVAKEALKEKKTIRQAVVDRGLVGDRLSEEELDRRLDVLAMTRVDEES